MKIIEGRAAGSPRCVLITGATGAIGGALALEYARAGTQILVLQGRDAARLRALGDACGAQGARAVTQVLDIRDHDALIAWLVAVSDAEMPDLVVVNAGVNINTGPNQRGEDWHGIQRLLDVNIKAAFATVQGVLPAMRKRRRGQIALISSLAAWRGLPETPSYCASKAAIKIYGEAMRMAMADEGIKFNVVMPGYVESQMCADMPGPKPFLWKPEKAARAIRRGLASNRARISFPLPLSVGCFLLSTIHPTASEWILKRLGYGA